MTKVSKKAWVEIGIGVCIFVALAIVAAFYDLQINKALFKPESLYAQFFQNLGEFPSYLAAPIIGTILFYCGMGKTEKIKKVWKIVWFVVVAAGCFMLGNWLWGRFSGEEIDFKMVYVILMAAVFTFVFMFIGSKIPEKTMKKLFWFAIFYAVIAIFTNVIVTVMKEIWARERFRVMVGAYDRDLVPYGDYSGFTAWYLPQGFKTRPEDYVALRNAVDEAMGHSGDAFKSFPSGHTGGASAILCLIILPDIMPKTFAGKKKQSLWAVGLFYTALVAISRIVMGAHYLSDVLFGGFVGIAVATLARWIIVNKVKNINQEPDLKPGEWLYEMKEVTVNDLEPENIV